MTPLRQRMMEDMTLRGFSARTQQSYVAGVAHLAKHYGKSPDQINEEELRQYFLWMTTVKKYARATVTIALPACACRTQTGAASSSSIEQFLLHVLPAGFTKVRHYGFLASAAKQKRARITMLLPTPPVAAVPTSAGDHMPAHGQPPLCPHCRIGHLLLVETLPRSRAPP